MIGKREIYNKSLEINLKEHKFPEENQHVVDDFRKYINKPGVWACYGITKDNPTNTLVCLNVGESDDIGTEMRVDHEYSMGKFNHRKGCYKNYEGKVLFTFDRPKNKPISTRERVWHDIGQKYERLCFVIVCESSEREERLKKEEEYALEHKALYWNPSPKQKRCK